MASIGRTTEFRHEAEKTPPKRDLCYCACSGSSWRRSLSVASRSVSRQRNLSVAPLNDRVVGVIPVGLVDPVVELIGLRAVVLEHFLLGRRIFVFRFIRDHGREFSEPAS